VSMSLPILTPCAAQTEILKSRLATQFTLSKQCRAHCPEFVSRLNPRTTFYNKNNSKISPTVVVWSKLRSQPFCENVFFYNYPTPRAALFARCALQTHSQLQVGCHRISRLLPKLCQHTRILHMGFTISTM